MSHKIRHIVCVLLSFFVIALAPWMAIRFLRFGYLDDVGGLLFALGAAASLAVWWLRASPQRPR